MAQFPTQHFTPTSTEASAWAWDSLADAVIGHEGTSTPAKDLDEAFGHLSDADAALLHKILYRVPSGPVHHLYAAIQRRRYQG